MNILSFLWSGITFAIFSKSGNSPVSKHKLINLDSQKEKNSLKAFRINTGIPLGPEDFFWSNPSINLLTSSGIVGERKKVHPSGLITCLPFGDFLCISKSCSYLPPLGFFAELWHQGLKNGHWIFLKLFFYHLWCFDSRPLVWLLIFY